MQITIAVVLYHLFLLTISFLQEADDSDFNDLGKLLLGGFVLAIAVALVFTFVKLRMRDKRPASRFISLSVLPKKD
jgi:hypothetical protein